jgi:hypothetical protein
MLLGLGSGNDISAMQSQGISPDIIDTYLVGVGPGNWPYYNMPTGSYVVDVINADEAVGAVPHLTLYQMATNGDGQIGDINDVSFMTAYWSQVKLMYQEIASTGKPVLVNLEPDFWGYVQLQAQSGDPTKLAAQVTIQPECASQPNNAVGIAGCLLTLGRTYAPKAKIGIPPSFFGESATSVGNFMKVLGAQNADFIVAQTSDRDAGCFEAALASGSPQECTGRGNGPFYWDENNVSQPNFADNLSGYVTVRTILGNNLPILYWQTPLGVPSTTAGGSANHYRANQVHYMLGHARSYVSAGVFGIVFSGGATSQTNISTDGGQFKNLSSAYFASPVAYP